MPELEDGPLPGDKTPPDKSGKKFGPVKTPPSGAPATPKSAVPPRKRFQSAVECAKCHDKIYDDWAVSMHARSYDDPLFKKALARAQGARGSRIREQCYSCHAPIAVVSGDYGFRKNGAAREGI